MKCIDFDKAFERYMGVWIKENAEKYNDNMDIIEGMMPDIYMAFLSKEADFLNGMAPQDYFEQFSDAQMLVDWLCRYMEEKVPVPDLLLERITALAGAAQEPLLALLDREDILPEAEIAAISLLREMQCEKPMQRYISYIAGLDAPDEKADLCADALLAMGEAAVSPILGALEDATQAGRDIFADILCNYPGDERIFDLLMERFACCEDRRALFASYLAKLGDERALPVLLEAAQHPECSYLDYVEIANAIEVLGGERPPQREFDGDPYYESLKRL